MLHPTRDTLNNQKLKLLIVEDDEDVRAQMKWAMARDYEILTAGNRGRRWRPSGRTSRGS